MKKALSMLLAVIMVLTLMVGCGEKPAPTPNEELSATQQIIKEAEGMTLEELAKKAIEESNGKTFYGVGNSSRGKSALPLFIEYLQSIDSSYTLNFEWQQPKNNKIFEQLTADSLKETGTFAMTLIQDGNQIESKMVKTGVLDTFIPKDWADANNTTADAYEGYTKEYLTFGYNSIPADYGDDEPAHERILIQVHYFAPQGVNTLAKRRRIKAALRGAGMTWPACTNASDGNGQHFVFECECGVGLGGE